MPSRIDREIVRILQENARTPISEIARHVGLSENGVRYRMEKMERSGEVQGYSAIINPSRFDRKVQAIITVKWPNEGNGKVLRLLRDMDELTAVYRTTGEHTLMAIGLFQDMEGLNAFLAGKMARTGITDYSVQIVMRRIKEVPFRI